MKSLFDYIQENEGGALSTPSNTMGMGNPGVLQDGNLTEPIATAKCKKEKPKKKKVSESILDDEDELINNTIKDTKNPFYFVSTLMSTNSNLLEYKSEIIRLFDNLIKSFNSYEPIKVFIYQSCIKIKYIHDHVEPIITLRPVNSRDDRIHFGVSSGANMLILFSDEHLHSLSDYGFNNRKQFYSWIKDISKKYNFKKSKKDEFVYYI